MKRSPAIATCVTACVATCLLGPPAMGQEHDHDHDFAPAPVDFPASRTPTAQAHFNTAAAVLYSFH